MSDSNIAYQASDYRYDWIKQVRVDGDKLKTDAELWRDLPTMLQGAYGDWIGMMKKIDSMRDWLLDETFQDFRDNVPDHADYYKFNDFYEAHCDWCGEFFDWLERCPFKELAMTGSDEVTRNE